MIVYRILRLLFSRSNIDICTHIELHLTTRVYRILYTVSTLAPSEVLVKSVQRSEEDPTLKGILISLGVFKDRNLFVF